MKKLFSLFALILLMAGFKAQAADEIYAVVSGKTMTIKYGTKSTGAYSVSEWKAHNTDFVPDLHATIHDVVETVVFHSSMQNVKPTSTAYWFSNFKALKKIESLSYLNTEDVTTMDHMFFQCGLLESIDLSGFNTAKVTNFVCMFYNCSSLKALDVSTFRTASATNLWSMFYGCSKLKSLDLAHFTTANVLTMPFMFENCTSLEEVDIRNFSTEKVTDMHEMFCGCSQLRTIYCLNDWTNVSNSVNMFKGCTSLVGGKDSKCDGKTAILGTYALVDGIGDKKGYFTAPKEVYTEYADGVLTYKYDDQRLYSDKKTEVYHPETKRFAEYRNEVLSAVVDPSMKEANLTSTRRMFYGKDGINLPNMTTISGLENLNTENVEDMTYMFYECRALESLDLSGFNTAKATNISCMFDGCYALKELDLRSFNTANVTVFNYIFNDCKALEKVDLSSFNTEKATNMTCTFANCTSLKELDLSSFNTPELVLMNSMFKGCTALEKLDLSMFNTAKVTNMKSLLEGCTALQEVDLSGFDITNVTTLETAFKDCSSLKTIYCSGDWTSSTATVTDLFLGCEALEGGKKTKYDANKVKNEYACWDGKNNKPGYFTPANTVYTEYDDGVLTYRYDHNAYYSTKNAEVYNPMTNRFISYYDKVKKAVIDPSMKEAKLTTTQNMFWGNGNYRLTKMETIEGLENLNTSEVTSMRSMFEYCSLLKELDLSTFDTRKVTNMLALFYECNALEKLNISSFRTTNVTIMQAMFEYCSSLKELDLSGFNTRNVTNMSYMFKGCSSLEQVDLSSFNTANVTEMEDMFWDCGALKELNLNNFNMGKVTTTKNMFNGCTVLKTIYCNDIWPKPTTSSVNMFAGCLALVGGNETAYSGSYTDITYARLDGLGNLKGYFTATAEVYTEYEDGVLTYRYDDQRHKSYKKAEKYDPEVIRFEGYRSDIVKAVIDPSMKDANLKTTASMFYGFRGYTSYGMNKLETIEGLENLNTEKVLDMYSMFREANELRNLDLSHFNTANVEKMNFMFCDSKRLQTVDISSFQMDNVVDASNMFDGCERLETIYHNGDWTKSDMEATYMFYACERLVGRSGTKFDSSDQTNKTYARLDGGKDKPGYFTGVYTVTLTAENGSATVNESVDLGHVLEGTELSFSATPNEGYVLSGWTNYTAGSSLTVTDNVTVTANFKLKTFTVTFYDWDSKELKSETVEYSKAATAPESPVREGFVFAGWDTDFSSVKSDLKVKALYKSAEGIENVFTTDSPQKIVRDGQIYILIGEKMYDVTGKAIK